MTLHIPFCSRLSTTLGIKPSTCRTLGIILNTRIIIRKYTPSVRLRYMLTESLLCSKPLHYMRADTTSCLVWGWMCDCRGDPFEAGGICCCGIENNLLVWSWWVASSSGGWVAMLTRALHFDGGTTSSLHGDSLRQRRPVFFFWMISIILYFFFNLNMWCQSRIQASVPG